jgi:hypothetical protein
VAKTTPSRSSSSGRDGEHARRTQTSKESTAHRPETIVPATDPAPVDDEAAENQLDRRAAVVRGVPFWGTAGFLALYGAQQSPLIQQLGPAWSAWLSNGTHYLAMGLGFYFTAEGGRRARVWISSLKIHVEFWAGRAEGHGPDRRES